jgi:NAD(P)-dependent dehydrogenase (short-subunit alcohol dehydrogenase family)
MPVLSALSEVWCRRRRRREKMSRWTAADIPSQRGKLAVVTGATGGLGYVTAYELARAGCSVVLTGRDLCKGTKKIEEIKRRIPDADVRFEHLDLSDLACVIRFVDELQNAASCLDILVNNAGVMAIPTRMITVDGFEMQFGVNYLGHYALTMRLLPLLRAATAPRVVSLSSIAHRTGFIDFADLQGSLMYDPWKAYAQSKLAMLIFAVELQRRSDANRWRLTSAAAHPGWARTELLANGPGKTGLVPLVSQFAAPFFSQSAKDGALPTLFAAASPAAKRGGYYGPDGLFELRGKPGAATMMPHARSAPLGTRLWDVTERLANAAFGKI